jgi:hypothetical protein
MLWFLITSEHQLYSVSVLQTLFGLVVCLLQSQPHVTAIIDNYFLRCVTFTQLKFYMFRILTLLAYSLPNTFDIFTLPVSVSYRDLTRRTTT